MSAIGSGSPIINPFSVKEGVSVNQFQQKVDTSLSKTTLTKENYKALKDSMTDGRQTLDSMLKTVGVPSQDIEAAFARGKSGNINLTSSQVDGLKTLLSGAEESKASPILKSLKAIDMSVLNNEGDSMSRTISLGAEAGISISLQDSVDPATSSVLKVLGIDAEAHAGASIEKGVKVSGEVLEGGKIQLSFESTLKGGVNAGASVKALGVEAGIEAEGEAGVKIETKYTFKDKTEANNFLRSTGLGFKEVAIPTGTEQEDVSLNNKQFTKSTEKTPYTSVSKSSSETVFVQRTTGSGEGLSHQTSTYQSMRSPGKKEQEWALETQKGGITRVIGLEIPKSSVKLTLSSDTTVSQTTPPTPTLGKKASVDIGLNLDKIRGTGANIDKLTTKMTERLIGIMTKANTETGNLIDTTKARSTVKGGLEKLFAKAQDSLIQKGTPLKSITFDAIIAEVEVKYGSMLSMNFALTPSANGKKLEPGEPTTISLNGSMGIKGSFGLTGESSPIKLNVSAGYEKETVKRL